MNDGGPAFPLPCSSGSGVRYCDGMTLRQWYAGMALQGLLSSIGDVAMPNYNGTAQKALNYADALLAQESKEA